MEVAGDARGVGADDGDGGRRQPRHGDSIRIGADRAGAQQGANRLATLGQPGEQIGHYENGEGHPAQPVAHRHRGNGERGRHPIPRLALLQRHVEQADGQREQAHGGLVGAFTPDHQRDQPARAPEAVRVHPGRRRQQERRRNQRVAHAGDKRALALPREPPRHPEQRDRTQAVDHGGDEVVGQAGGHAGQRHYQPADPVEQRRVRVGVGNAAVPQREPAHVVPVLGSVARQSDKGRVDGGHLVGVGRTEQKRRDVGVE